MEAEERCKKEKQFASNRSLARFDDVAGGEKEKTLPAPVSPFCP